MISCKIYKHQDGEMGSRLAIWIADALHYLTHMKQCCPVRVSYWEPLILRRSKFQGTVMSVNSWIYRTYVIQTGLFSSTYEQIVQTPTLLLYVINLGGIISCFAKACRRHSKCRIFKNKLKQIRDFIIAGLNTHLS